MKRFGLIVATVLVTVSAFNVPVVHSSEGKTTSNEERNNFIKEFQRTGLNTTPESLLHKSGSHWFRYISPWPYNSASI